MIFFRKHRYALSWVVFLLAVFIGGEVVHDLEFVDKVLWLTTVVLMYVAGAMAEPYIPLASDCDCSENDEGLDASGQPGGAEKSDR